MDCARGLGPGDRRALWSARYGCPNCLILFYLWLFGEISLGFAGLFVVWLEDGLEFLFSLDELVQLLRVRTLLKLSFRDFENFINLLRIIQVFICLGKLIVLIAQLGAALAQGGVRSR